MNRKCKISIIIGIIIFLLLSMLPTNTKGDEEKPWEITFEGKENVEIFRNSVDMEIYLKGETTPEDITVFVNQKKIDIDWDYEQSAKITFSKEGKYKIHVVDKNGFEETRYITIELSNPTAAKITTKGYAPGIWTRQDVTLEAYGARSTSGISHYEYKTAQGEWKQMKDGRLYITKSFDDIIYIRPVSNAGREGEIRQIWVRVWKKKPNLPHIKCDQNERNGWYQKIPSFSYEIDQEEGPALHVYAKLTDLETKETQTGIDQIPVIHKDGRYQLKIFTKDVAGNESESVYQKTCQIDSIKPEISVEYEKKNSKVLKYQKAKIRIKDKNLKKESIILNTTGSQRKPWKQQKDIYEIEIIFQKNGDQSLYIQAEDFAGNKIDKEGETFKIDTVKPKIIVSGITGEKSYKKPVKFQVDIEDKNPDQDKTRIYLNGKRTDSCMVTRDGYYTLKIEAEDLAGNKNFISKRFTVNQRGIQISFLQNDLKGKEIAIKDLKPGFRIKSLEPVQVMEFLLNEKKMAYEWKGDEVYLKEPVVENGSCHIRMKVKDTTGKEKESEEISFFYDTKKPEIKIKGLDNDQECEYGKKISISLSDKKDRWEKVIMDGKEETKLTDTIRFQDLEPGKHVLDIRAVDRAGNQTIRKIRFKITKILPKSVKKMVSGEESQTLDQQEKNKKNKGKVNYQLWIFMGIAMSVLLMGIIRKYRKHEHS